jgi:hypothetical protein
VDVDGWPLRLRVSSSTSLLLQAILDSSLVNRR